MIENIEEVRSIFYNGYVEGAIKLIDVLEGALEESGGDCILKEWLVTAREEFSNLKLIKPE